jgi:IS5 family transposase
VAQKTGALATRDLERVVVDTTVQPKAIVHPTDARLCHRALEKLVDLAQRHDVPLRQSYRRVAKRAAIMVRRYTHAHQFKRARRASPPAGSGDAGAVPGSPSARPQGLCAACPEVERIGKGKARAPYEFGCKVSMATPATKPKGGQFVLHAKAFHGNPFDGHTLGPVITELEQLTGIETRRIHVDEGYRGHNHKEKFRVWISGQVQRVTRPIRREMKRRAAVEPVIGHVKAKHRMSRYYLKGRDGDRINAVLAAAGYNFGLLLRWLASPLRALLRMLLGAPPVLKRA